MGWLLNSWRESAARREVAGLSERLGLVFLPGTGTWTPNVVATIDQHAAAVRDILTLSGGKMSLSELACYARGVQDVARDAGWHPAPFTDDAGWTSDWVNLRLAAVCLLAAAGTVAVAMAGGDPSIYF